MGGSRFPRGLSQEPGVNTCITALQGKTPYAMWTGRKLDISHLREFGSAVWVLLEGQPDKLWPKVAKFILTGYSDDSSSFRFYDARTCQIKSSRNLQFELDLTPSIRQDPVFLPLEGEQGTGRVAPVPSTALAPEKHEAVLMENDGVPMPDERPEHSKQPEDVLPRRSG